MNASATATDNPTAPALPSHHWCLVPNGLGTDAVQTQILTLVKPQLSRREFLSDQKIRSPEYRSAGKVIRIDGDDPGIFIIRLGEVACYFLSVGLAGIDADERRRYVGLLVKVGKTEAREYGFVIDDGGLVLGSETSTEVVLSLGSVAVDTINEGWN